MVHRPILITAFLLAACSTDSSSPDLGESSAAGSGGSGCTVGSEGCDCYPNETCSRGLECGVGNRCNDELAGGGGTGSGGSSGGNASGGGNAGTGACVGGFACECYPNGTCDEGLECFAGAVCAEPGNTGGTAGTGGTGNEHANMSNCPGFSYGFWCDDVCWDATTIPTCIAWHCVDGALECKSRSCENECANEYTKCTESGTVIDHCEYDDVDLCWKQTVTQCGPKWTCEDPVTSESTECAPAETWSEAHYSFEVEEVPIESNGGPRVEKHAIVSNYLRTSRDRLQLSVRIPHESNPNVLVTIVLEPAMEAGVGIHRMYRTANEQVMFTPSFGGTLYHPLMPAVPLNCEVDRSDPAAATLNISAIDMRASQPYITASWLIVLECYEQSDATKSVIMNYRSWGNFHAVIRDITP